MQTLHPATPYVTHLIHPINASDSPDDTHLSRPIGGSPYCAFLGARGLRCKWAFVPPKAMKVGGAPFLARSPREKACPERGESKGGGGF
jgi:hypothetical protein